MLVVAGCIVTNNDMTRLTMGKKLDKRLYIVKDCANGNELVVEMNNDFAFIEGITLETLI